jgi:hypothetical protein
MKPPPKQNHSDGLVARAVGTNAGRHLALYLREPNGLLIWRAFSEYRRAKLPVPENILAKLDQFANRLERASGTAEIAKAIEMHRAGGGSGGAAHAARLASRRDIAEAVEAAFEAGNWNGKKRTYAECYRIVGAERGEEPARIKAVHIEWTKDRRPLPMNPNLDLCEATKYWGSKR